MARKEEVTKMAGPDLLSYRIQNYQRASSLIQHLRAQTSLGGSPPSHSEALKKTNLPCHTSQFSICACGETRRPMFIDCWLRASLFDACFLIEELAITL